MKILAVDLFNCTENPWYTFSVLACCVKPAHAAVSAMGYVNVVACWFIAAVANPHCLISDDDKINRITRSRRSLIILIYPGKIRFSNRLYYLGKAIPSAQSCCCNSLWSAFKTTRIRPFPWCRFSVCILGSPLYRRKKRRDDCNKNMLLSIKFNILRIRKHSETSRYLQKKCENTGSFSCIFYSH